MLKIQALEVGPLRIRQFRESDVAALYELTRQREITDILPEWDMSMEQTRDFLAFVIGSYERFNPDDVRILLAIEHAEERKLIGWCGVFPNEKLPPEEREIAYALSKDYRNRGYTTEAVREVLNYIFAHTSLQEVAAIVKPHNVTSCRVLEKAGFELRNLRTLADGHAYHYYVRQK